MLFVALDIIVPRSVFVELMKFIISDLIDVHVCAANLDLVMDLSVFLKLSHFFSVF